MICKRFLEQLSQLISGIILFFQQDKVFRELLSRTGKIKLTAVDFIGDHGLMVIPDRAVILLTFFKNRAVIPSDLQYHVFDAKALLSFTLICHD